MASTYYDWHLASSQGRMQQRPLFDNGVQVAKYHHKEGLILNFLAVVSGKQLTVLLDKQHSLELRNQILNLFPADEITRLRIAMTSIKHHAKIVAADTDLPPYCKEYMQAIQATAESWPEIEADAQAQAEKIVNLESKLREMKETARQLIGIQAWITDGEMKRHFMKCIEKLTR